MCLWAFNTQRGGSGGVVGISRARAMLKRPLVVVVGIFLEIVFTLGV